MSDINIAMIYLNCFRLKGQITDQEIGSSILEYIQDLQMSRTRDRIMFNQLSVTINIIQEPLTMILQS